MANLTSSLTIKVLADTKQAKTAAQALRDVEKNAKAAAKAMEGSGATDRFTKSLAGLKLQAKDIDVVRKAWADYAKSANLAGDASKWTKQQAADVRAWEKQTISALRTVKREQAQFYRAQSDAAKKAAIAQEAAARKAAASEMTPKKMLIGAAGLAAGHKVGEFKRKVTENYREADDSSRYQAAMSDLTERERQSRIRQAETLGPAKGVKPLDILHAQQTLAGRGVKKEFVEPFTEQLTNYARAMNTDMASAAKTLETIIFSTNQHIENAGEARKSMQRQIDIAVKAAKVGGLDDSDIQMGAKFGAASGHAGGFRNETIFGIMAALSRAGYRGDEGGVATRAIASKLVSPTAKGLDALTAMGIDYNQFAKAGAGMDPANLEAMTKRRFGKSFNQDQIAKLREIMGNSDTVGSRNDFVAQVSEVIAQSFDKNKKGETKAQDAQKIAKLAGDFYKNAIQSVDVEGLLAKILESHPSLQQLNSLFTSQHGGKVSALAENAERFKQIVEAINHVGEGFAQGIGDKRNEGFAGSMNKLEAAFDTLTIRVGQVNDDMMKWSADMLGSALKKAGEAPDGVLKWGSRALGALGLTSAGLGAYSFLGGGGIGGAARAAMMPFGWAARATGAPGLTAAAANVMAGNPLDIGLSADEAARKNKKRRDLEESHKPYGSSRSQDDALKERLNAARAAPKVETGDLEKAKTAAEGAKEAIDGMNVTASPKVETSSIDAALEKVKQLNAELAKAGSLAASAKASAAAAVGSLGKVQRGRFSFGGVQGE